MTAPVNRVWETPQFPEELKKKKRELSPILVECVVSKEGAVEDPEVLSTANADLHPYVLDAIRKCRYEPAQEKGQPVEVFLVVRVLLHGDGR